MFIFLINLTNSLFCSEIDIGTSPNHLNNIVESGEIKCNLKSAEWHNDTFDKKFSVLEPEFFIYITGLEILGPDF